MSNTTTQKEADEIAKQIAEQTSPQQKSDLEDLASKINKFTDTDINTPPPELVKKFNGLPELQKIYVQTLIEGKIIDGLNTILAEDRKFNFVEKPAGVGGRNRKTRKNRKTKKSHKKRRSYSRRR